MAERLLASDQRPAFIVAVDGFEGEQSAIVVHDGAGAPLPVVYCIARQNEVTCVLEFVDYGYRSIEEAREAWPGTTPPTGGVGGNGMPDGLSVP